MAVYNREVRRLVKEGEKHRHFTDDWADIHYIEVTADDENAARVKIEARYPEDKGFVIEQVTRADEPL